MLSRDETRSFGHTAAAGGGDQQQQQQQRQRLLPREAVVEPPPQLPTDTKGYYACRGCRRVLVESQWVREGCLGCGTGPVPRGDLPEFATTHFTNFFGIIDGERSWVARLIGKGGHGPGQGADCPNAIFAEALSDEDEDDFDDEEEEDDGDGEGEVVAAASGDGGRRAEEGRSAVHAAVAGAADDVDLGF